MPWHVGTQENLARRHVGTLARKKIWHVRELVRLARMARNLADSMFENKCVASNNFRVVS